MLENISKLIILLTIFCISSCCGTQEGEYVILSFNEEFVSYSTYIDRGIIVRKKKNWASTNNCISYSNTEKFKLVKDILYIKQEIEEQEVWYPYLLLSSSKGVSYSDISSPIITYTITNSIVGKSDSTYLIHQTKREVNGHVNWESFITLNKYWLPIKEKELIVPFGEQKGEYILTDSSIKIPKDRCD